HLFVACFVPAGRAGDDGDRLLPACPGRLDRLPDGRDPVPGTPVGEPSEVSRHCRVPPGAAWLARASGAASGLRVEVPAGSAGSERRPAETPGVPVLARRLRGDVRVRVPPALRTLSRVRLAS